MIALGVVVALLTIVVGVHLLLTLGLVGRLRTLAENGIGRPLRNPDMPAPGLVIGEFRATDLAGRPVSRTDLVGPVTAAFFTVGCAMCARLAGDLVADPPQEPTLVFIEGDPDSPHTRRLIEDLAPLARVCMIGVDDPIILAFALVSFPTVLRTHSGVVLASGARLAHLDEERPAVGARRT